MRDDLGDTRDGESVGDESPEELGGEAQSTEGGHDGIADLDGTGDVRWTEVAPRGDEYGAWPVWGKMDGVPGVPADGFRTLEEKRAKELHGRTVVLAWRPAGGNVDTEKALKGLSGLNVGIDQRRRCGNEDEAGCTNGLHRKGLRSIA